MSKRAQGALQQQPTPVKLKELYNHLAKTRKRSLWKRLKVARTTIQASGVLVLAIVTALIYNWVESHYSSPKESQNVRLFLSKICNDHSVYCDSALAPSRRTQKAIRKIPSGRSILEIPRTLQIWDLDALRDRFVRNELFPARIANHSPLVGAAYLAAYLARLQQNQQERKALDPLLQEYLDILPTYSEYAEYHPILWNENELEDSFGRFSTTYDTVQGLRTLISSEYAAFCMVSPAFAGNTTLEQYQAARLSVITRSFGTGRYDLDEQELSFYRSAAGVDLRQGSHAMVPILDSYDHHARPHVEFSFNTQKQCFVVSTIRAIPPGAEVFDTYGKRTDSDLFARYGFVNGDGSGWTQASLALWHKVMEDAIIDPGMDDSTGTKQRQLMLHYLQYDDGYEDCVDPSQADAWKMKKLKYQFLRKIANTSSRWVVLMAPRDRLAEPGTASNVPTTLKPPSFDRKTVSFDATMIMSTCRLISLTHMDYNYSAEEILTRNLANASFVLPATEDALEFRTLMCVARMASTALARFGTDPGRVVAKQYARVARLNQDSFQSRNWTIAQLILGELQTLEILKETAFSKLRPFQSKMETEPAYSMRNDPCPLEYLQRLLDEVDEVQ